MKKRFASLDDLQEWLESVERSQYEIEYIVRDRGSYLVLFHRLTKAA